MITVASVVFFILQITICAVGCSSGSSNGGNSKNPFRFRGARNKTKFHVRGDTDVATNGAVSVASTASKIPEDQKEKKLSQQEDVQKEKDKSINKTEKNTENEKGKSEKKLEKKPLISVEPSGDLPFKAESESQTRMTLKNISDNKIMFKIKVSDHAYNACPVFGTLDVEESADIVITHIPSMCKEAKMIIINSKYVGEVDLVKSFRNAKPTGGPVTINLIAT